MVTASKILVTGGAGMIGSVLVKKLVALGHEVHVADNLWRGTLENLHDDHGVPVIDLQRNFYNVDLAIECPSALLNGVDYVFHLADIVAGIGYVFNNQGFVFRQNVLINSNVINAVRNNPVKGFVYVGTACSFPAHLQSADVAYQLREEDQYPANPESAYGWSKLMGEYEALLMEKETGIPVSVLVLHNVYGAPADLDDSRSQVIPSLIKKAVRFPKQDFIVWGSGKQGRAFLHVDDVVSALVNALERGLGQGVIQIGPSECISIQDIAREIVRISGKDIEIQFDTTKPEGDRARCADYSKATRVLGWSPEVPLSEGLERLYRWVEQRI